MLKILPLALSAFLMASCGKDPEVIAEKPVEKKVSFHVFAGQDYTSSFYNNVSAEVSLHIYKYNRKTGSGGTIYDTTMHFRPIVHYPQQSQEMLVEKLIPLINSTEQLTISSVIRYFQDPYTTANAKTIELMPDETSKDMEVKL